MHSFSIYIDLFIILLTYLLIRKKERVFYLTLAAPEHGHMAAG